MIIPTPVVCSVGVCGDDDVGVDGGHDVVDVDDGSGDLGDGHHSCPSGYWNTWVACG